MPLAELKTKRTDASADRFLTSIEDPQRRKDAFTISSLMEKLAKAKPEMWGAAIVGFGRVHLKYESGRELDWMKIGFSPRKSQLVLYVLNGSKEQTALLKKLGKHTTGKGCLYVKSLADVDLKTLEGVIKISLAKKAA